MALRARIEETKEHRQEQQRELESEQRKLADANVELARLEPRIAELAAETERMRDTLAQNATASQIRELESEIDRKKTKLGAAENAAIEVWAILKQQSNLVTLLVDDRIKDVRRDLGELFAKDIELGASHPPEIMARVQTCIERGDFLEPRDIEVWQPLCAQLDDEARDVRQRLGSSLEAPRTEGKRLEAELGNSIADASAIPSQPKPYCICCAASYGVGARRDRCASFWRSRFRWTDAIEGFSASVAWTSWSHQRTSLVRSPCTKSTSMATPCLGPVEVFLGGVGLVDLERLLKRAPRAERVRSPSRSPAKMSWLAPMQTSRWVMSCAVTASRSCASTAAPSPTAPCFIKAMWPGRSLATSTSARTLALLPASAAGKKLRVASAKSPSSLSNRQCGLNC